MVPRPTCFLGENETELALNNMEENVTRMSSHMHCAGPPRDNAEEYDTGVWQRAVARLPALSGAEVLLSKASSKIS